MMKVLVSGVDGFIGRNLRLALAERGDTVLPITRRSTAAELCSAARKADAVVHLAGVNRPREVGEFAHGNDRFTAQLCDALRAADRPIPAAFASSIQAAQDNLYGVSKRAAEDHLNHYGEASGAPVALYRLANVFGKWSRPNYNSVVATFCHNIARGLPIRVDEPAAALRLVYIDDVVAEFLRFLTEPGTGVRFASVEPVYSTTVGELAKRVIAFASERESLTTERVGTGLLRALYATYVSFLPASLFSYRVPDHTDSRGTFAEMLRTPDCGQLSFFTAHPGVTRGGHYHHTKSEKFLVLQGCARYRFRNLLTDEHFEIESSAKEPLVVQTIPGWAHDITNIGEGELIVMLWANEVFDPEKPDTVAAKV